MRPARLLLVCLAALCASKALGQVADPAFCEPAEIKAQQGLLSAEQWERVEENAALIRNGTGRFWRITAPNGRVSHLWASTASADPRISALPPDLQEVISEAETVLMAHPGAALGQAQAERALAPRARFSPTSQEVIYKLSDEAAHGVLRRLDQFGHNIEEIDRLHPAYILDLAMRHPCADRLLAAGFPVQERRIESLAIEAGTPVVALDSKETLEILATKKSWRKSYIAALRIHGLRQLDTQSTATRLHLYQTGQIARLMEFERVYFENLFPNTPVRDAFELSDRYLLTQRTMIMLENARPLLDQGGAFWAAEMRHLLGKNGIISTLKADGFRVVRVRIAGEAE